MADNRIARAEHDGTEGTIIAPPGRDPRGILRGVPRKARSGSGAGETVHVEWKVSVVESYAADVDIAEWANAVKNHDTESFLADLEVPERLVDADVTTDREVMGIGVNE